MLCTGKYFCNHIATMCVTCLNILKMGIETGALKRLDRTLLSQAFSIWNDGWYPEYIKEKTIPGRRNTHLRKFLTVQGPTVQWKRETGMGPVKCLSCSKICHLMTRMWPDSLEEFCALPDSSPHSNSISWEESRSPRPRRRLSPRRGPSPKRNPMLWSSYQEQSKPNNAPGPDQRVNVVPRRSGRFSKTWPATFRNISGPRLRNNWFTGHLCWLRPRSRSYHWYHQLKRLEHVYHLIACCERAAVAAPGTVITGRN